MTTEQGPLGKPLTIRRLTPAQICLGLLVSLMAFALIALLVSAYHNIGVTTRSFESSRLLTDLAEVQRAVTRLQLETVRVLQTRQPDTHRLLVAQTAVRERLRNAAGSATNNERVTQALQRIDGRLAEYAALVDAMRTGSQPQAAELAPAIEQALDALNEETRLTYQREEILFLSSVGSALRVQRNSQAIVLGVSGLLIVFAALMIISVRRTVAADFERAYRSLETLYRADEELYRHLRLDEVLQALANVAVDVLEADRSAVLVCDANTDRLVFRAATGFGGLPQASFPLTDGMMGLAGSSAKPVVVPDLDIAPLAEADLAEQLGVRALMHVPIHVDGQVFGIFHVGYARPRAFGEEEQRAVMALARRASLAIENARLYEQAQHAAAVEERQRLARELHDAVTQTLFSAGLIADALPRIFRRHPDEALKRLEELRQLNHGALAEMRTLLLELRPSALADAPLGELMKQLAEATSGRARVPISVHVAGDCDLPLEAKLALYRIAQEALSNVAKHADATKAEVRLCAMQDRVLLAVADDGRGFDPTQVRPGSLGLGIMRERSERIGATFEVMSRPGGGTEIAVTWSVAKTSPAAPPANQASPAGSA